MDVAIVVALLGVASTFITAVTAIIVALIQSGRIDRKVSKVLEEEEDDE